MIRLKHLLMCYLLLAVLPNAYSEPDIELITREYPIPEHGLLALDVPEPWNVTYYEPDDIKAPIIIFYPQEEPHGFQLTISALWDEGYFRNITEREYIRNFVEAIGSDILLYSDQDTLELKEIKGKQGQGYYFQLSDKSAPDSEFQYLTQGALAVGELLIVFSYVSRKENDLNTDIILEMMRKAVQNHQRQVQLIYPLNKIIK